MAGFRANGLITLTTDFGSREPFVGIMKGVMLAHAAQLRFVDMAHEVNAFQPVEAGFWLSRALRYFPAGTLHVAVVDPGVGTPRDLVVAFSGDQALLAPDNGLLAPLAARGSIDRIIRVDLTRLVQFGVSDVSATFHGRDVFAPLAAAIASGRCDPADLGTEMSALSTSGWPATMTRADGGVAPAAHIRRCARGRLPGPDQLVRCAGSRAGARQCRCGLESGRGGAHFGRSGRRDCPISAQLKVRANRI